MAHTSGTQDVARWLLSKIHRQFLSWWAGGPGDFSVLFESSDATVLRERGDLGEKGIVCAAASRGFQPGEIWMNKKQEDQRSSTRHKEWEPKKSHKANGLWDTFLRAKAFLNYYYKTCIRTDILSFSSLLKIIILIIFKDSNLMYFWVNDPVGPEAQLPEPVAQKRFRVTGAESPQLFLAHWLFPGLTLTLLEALIIVPFCLISCLFSNDSRISMGPCHVRNYGWIGSDPVSNTQPETCVP